MHLIFHVHSFYASNGATLTGIHLYDENKQRLNYSVKGVAQKLNNNTPVTPTYWNSNMWDSGNLNNGNIVYTGNASGQTACTLVNYSGAAANSNSRTRFAIQVSEKDVPLIKNAEIFLGSPEGRIPHYVDIYMVSDDQYSASKHITNFNDDHLMFVKRINLFSTDKAVKAYNFYNELAKNFVVEKIIFRKEEKIFSINPDSSLVNEIKNSDNISDIMKTHGHKLGIEMNGVFNRKMYSYHSSIEMISLTRKPLSIKFE